MLIVALTRDDFLPLSGLGCCLALGRMCSLFIPVINLCSSSSWWLQEWVFPLGFVRIKQIFWWLGFWHPNCHRKIVLQVSATLLLQLNRLLKVDYSPPELCCRQTWRSLATGHSSRLPGKQLWLGNRGPSLPADSVQ